MCNRFESELQALHIRALMETPMRVMLETDD
jgi:hypothetical protein